ncbi:MAG: hypothetical protein ACRDI3_04920, partial [Actinomycetota bacterium]
MHPVALRSSAAALVCLLIAMVPAPGAGAGPLDEVAADGRCDPIDPAHCLFPFPNDVFTRPDSDGATGRRVNLNVASMPRNFAGVPINPLDWNRSDGFSPGSLIVTKVPGLDTPEALSATDPVTLRDLSRYTEEDAPVVVLNAETAERHPIFVELDMTASTAEDRTLLIRPAVNFEEGTRYIVALRDLRDSNGDLLEAGPAFAAFRDAERVNCDSGGDCEGDPAGDGAARSAHYQSIFHTLEEAGIGRKKLYLAWDFTVASERNLSERILTIRDDAFARLGDTDLDDLTIQGDSPEFEVTAVTDNPEPQILRRVEGTVTVPCYLNLPRCPSGAQFLYDGPDATVPTWIEGNTYDARFICNITNTVLEEGPARPSLYGHGLLNSAEEVNQRKLFELGSNHNFMFCGADWIGMAEEDVPNDASLLLDLGRFSSLADRLQQSFVNFLYIGRTMIHPDGFSSDEAFQVDGTST